MRPTSSYWFWARIIDSPLKAIAKTAMFALGFDMDYAHGKIWFRDKSCVDCMTDDELKARWERSVKNNWFHSPCAGINIGPGDSYGCPKCSRRMRNSQ